MKKVAKPLMRLSAAKDSKNLSILQRRIWGSFCYAAFSAAAPPGRLQRP